MVAQTTSTSAHGSRGHWYSGHTRRTNHQRMLPPLTAASLPYSTCDPSSSSSSSSSNRDPMRTLEDDEDDKEELVAVDTAIKMNGLIFVAKLVVFCISGSSAMLAEAVHSLVDVANQFLLRTGILKAQRPPSLMHPYGFSRDQFIWPLISAVGIFCCGAGVSLIHGIQGILDPRQLGDLYWNFVVLGVSGLLEGYSLYVATSMLYSRAKKQNLTLLQYLRTGADPAATAVMMEDGAAVAGLAIAGGCSALVQATGNAVWDGVGSISVGLLLGVVAVVLIQRNRKWLIGKSMPREDEQQVVEFLNADKVIRAVYDAKSEELGIGKYRFKAEIAFDGEEIARRCLQRCGTSRLYQRVTRAASSNSAPGALDAVFLHYTDMVVTTMGTEVDRLEREIQAMNPGIKYVDLETDRGWPLTRKRRIQAAAIGSSAIGSSAMTQDMRNDSAGEESDWSDLCDFDASDQELPSLPAEATPTAWAAGELELPMGGSGGADSSSKASSAKGGS